MSEKPTIYLSNFASHRTKGHHGPGRLFSIMARTPHWSPALGVVSALVPDAEDLWPALAGEISMDEYRERYERTLSEKGDILAPGRLIVRSRKQLDSLEVRDGDTLCCVCARSEAAANRCHRVWAAPFLAGQGWRVFLDGKLVPSMH